MAVITGGTIMPGVGMRSGAVLPQSAAEAGGVFKLAKGHYDFSAVGGTQGAFNLIAAGQGVLPSGAVVVGGFIFVTTPPTSAANTATIAISVEGANDIVSAIIVTNAQWTGANSFHAIIPVLTPTTFKQTTAARNIVATVAVQDLTAGVFDVYLYYMDGL